MDVELSQEQKWAFSPYFDQENPERDVLGILASRDASEPYELDAAAVFDVVPVGFLVVYVSGCSCWPDRGQTTQVYCATRADLDRELTGDWRAMLDECQRKWSSV